MKKLFSLVTLLFIFSCSNKKDEAQTSDQNKEFETYKANFVEALWKLHPGWASSIGYHNYDSILTVPDENQRSTELTFYSAQLDSLKHFELAALSKSNITDYHMMEDFFKSGQWSITDLKSYQWDPSNYNVCGS